MAMIYNNYAKQYASVINGRRQITRGSYVALQGVGNIPKITAVLVVTAMLLGVLGSMGFGWLIQARLNDLAVSNHKQMELTVLNNKLTTQRNYLLSEARIVDAVQRSGLYLPTSGQIRRP